MQHTVRGAKIILISLYAIPLLLLTPTEAMEECSPCTCSYTPWQGRYFLTADCSGLKLFDAPDISAPIYILDLSNNNLKEDTQLNISKFQYLLSLRIRYNSLKTLPTEFLSGGRLLREVDFTGNKLDIFSPGSLVSLKHLDTIRGLEAKYFSDDAFNEFESLRTLEITLFQSNISENLFSNLKLSSLNLRILASETIPTRLLYFGQKYLSDLLIFAPYVTHLSELIFNGLSLLEKLHLHFERLQSLPLHVFSNPSIDAMPRHLLCLSIVGVKSLPRGLLQGQQRLETLTLSGIEDLPSGIFADVQTLHHLNLSTCNLKRISPYWFSKLGSLKSLNLSSTGLKGLSNDSLFGLNSLSVLDLSHNDLSSLQESAFEYFRETLLYLNVTDNSIGYITEKLFSGMFSLQSLDLSYNGIVKVSTKSFADLSKLQILNLRNNSLYYIPEDVLQYQQDLLVLDLSNNNLTTLPKNLLQNAISLRVLDLSNNPVSSFPESFFANSRFLEFLILEGNPLHCDCRLFVIESQTSGPMFNMTGMCLSPDSVRGRPVSAVISLENCSTDQEASSSSTKNNLVTYTSTVPFKTTPTSIDDNPVSYTSTTTINTTPSSLTSSEKEDPSTATTTVAAAFTTAALTKNITTSSSVTTDSVQTTAGDTTPFSKATTDSKPTEVSEKPVVFEGKDFGSVSSSGMKAFYIAIGVIGALFVFGVIAYVVRRGRLGIRSRSYTINQHIIHTDDQEHI